MRGVRVEEAAAVGSQLLDRFLRCHRPLRDDLLRAFDGGDGRVGMQVLDHALEQNSSAADDRNRQQHIHRGARDIHPEVADGLLFLAGKSANQRDRDRDAGRGRGEILHRQSRHLHEVAQRRFARVSLPVRVGDEAGRCVEGQIGRDIAGVEVLRIERQNACARWMKYTSRNPKILKLSSAAVYCVQRCSTSSFTPISLVSQHLEPSQNRMQKRALALEHLRHVGAQRLGARQDQGEEQQRFAKFQC